MLDPELGLDIVSLGLVIDVREEREAVVIELTMTSAACPMAERVVEHARTAAAAVAEGRPVRVGLVWDLAWTPARMEPDARAALGWAETRAPTSGPLTALRNGRTARP